MSKYLHSVLIALLLPSTGTFSSILSYTFIGRGAQSPHPLDLPPRRPPWMVCPLHKRFAPLLLVVPPPVNRKKKKIPKLVQENAQVCVIRKWKFHTSYRYATKTFPPRFYLFCHLIPMADHEHQYAPFLAESQRRWELMKRNRFQTTPIKTTNLDGRNKFQSGTSRFIKVFQEGLIRSLPSNSHRPPP